MASTYVNDLRLTEMGTGDNSGTWGSVTNTNLTLIGDAFGYGTEAITTNADTHSTTIADGSTDPGRAMYLKYTGTLDSTCTVSLLPNTVNKLWIIENATSGSQSLSMKQGSGSEITIPNGHVKMIYTDGNSSSAAVTDALVDLNLGGSVTIADDLSVGDDMNMTSDAAKIAFGAGADVTVTHSADVGLVFKNTNTGDDKPFVLTLQTGETAIIADEELGKIQFQAPDESGGTDAILVAAEVAAVSEGTFAADNNATKLSFRTAASEAASEKMSLSSGGNLTVSGTYNGGGLMTTGGNIVIPNSGYIGSASDTDAVQINSTGNVYLTQGFRVEAGDTSLNSFYERGFIYMGRNQAGDNYTDMDGKGIIIYDDQGTDGTTFTKMVVANGTTAGDPVWQNKLSGTIKSEIEVSGDFLSATNSYASTSDARLKEHITDSGSQWNDIKAMRVRKYSFKEEKVDAPNMIGVIAQELESAGMDKLVKTHLESNPADDGGDEVPVLDSSGNQKSFKSVKYSVIHMKALKALQEAMDRIEALEAKVASLGG
jgi:hypothetical protein